MHDGADGQGIEATWADVQRRLRGSVPDATFRLWLEPLRAVGAQGEVLYLSAPAGIRAWVERRYSPLIREALAGAGTALREVSFAEGAGDPDSPPGQDGELNPSYVFERFVIGDGNRLAHAAALAVAEAPSEAYNPLFLHGPPGLGKTHLLVAIANYLRASAPGLSVRYTTAERFTSEFVAALRSSGAEAFKSRHRDLDVLLVDDVQFLEGKHHTEDEFFHTFNALHESGSQLVLSADRIPRELSNLEARLRDRFEWGLTLAVEPPNAATRFTVLRRLLHEAGVETADHDALRELAGRIDANVRRLRGALTRVVAHASLTDEPLTSKLIAELVPHEKAASDEPATTEQIRRCVCDTFGVSPEELAGASRSARPLRARQVAMLLTRELTDLSLPEIGRLYGGRDHSTVLNSLRRAEAGLAADPELSAKVAEIRGAIHSSPHSPPANAV
ncbi:MAG TPA: chromosomal replication initiator protein DnaA [Solirubrobacterales bacterium]|nr:chromosomal replication initiator protein DnaA [Solirubrobacterales bacterium]